MNDSQQGDTDGTQGTDLPLVLKAMAFNKSGDSNFIGQANATLEQLIQASITRKPLTLIDSVKRDKDKAYTHSGQLFVAQCQIMHKARKKDGAEVSRIGAASRSMMA